MPFGREKEELIQELESLVQFFNESKSYSVLPVSFFSSVNERIDQIKVGVARLEEVQYELLKRESEEKKEIIKEPEPVIVTEKTMPDPPKSNTHCIEDEIAKKIYSDFGKALSLNDRFRFQRDLFGNNTKQMEQTLDHLNTLDSYQEVMNYLNTSFDWDWNNDTAASFHELLVKRFA